MSALPTMPKATAIWLIDNTSLTFSQIADFCGIHEIEIRSIADGEVASGMQPYNPIDNGQLTQEEIERCQKNPKAKLQLIKEPLLKTRIGARYTPMNKRQSKPDAILWLLLNRPELSEDKICKLIGTTKKTVESIKNRSYKSFSELEPKDPVFLGLCTVQDMDAAMNHEETIKARAKEKEQKQK